MDTAGVLSVYTNKIPLDFREMEYRFANHYITTCKYDPVCKFPQAKHRISDNFYDLDYDLKLTYFSVRPDDCMVC